MVGFVRVLKALCAAAVAEGFRFGFSGGRSGD